MFGPAALSTMVAMFRACFVIKKKTIYTRLNCLDSCYKSGFEVWWKAKNHQFWTVHKSRKMSDNCCFLENSVLDMGMSPEIPWMGWISINEAFWYLPRYQGSHRWQRSERGHAWFSRASSLKLFRYRLKNALEDPFFLLNSGSFFGVPGAEFQEATAATASF